MDQLLAKIKETQVAHQVADEARANAQIGYYKAVEVAYEKLNEWHKAEHELLVILVQQHQRPVPAPAPVKTPLPTVPEEPVHEEATPAEAASTEEAATEETAADNSSPRQQREDNV